MARNDLTSIDDAFAPETPESSNNQTATDSSSDAQQQYDWIDDAFDDKRSPVPSKMSTGSKVAVGCGCVVALVVLAIVIMLSLGVLVSVGSDFVG